MSLLGFWVFLLGFWVFLLGFWVSLLGFWVSLLFSFFLRNLNKGRHRLPLRVALRLGSATSATGRLPQGSGVWWRGFLRSPVYQLLGRLVSFNLRKTTEKSWYQLVLTSLEDLAKCPLAVLITSLLLGGCKVGCSFFRGGDIFEGETLVSLRGACCHSQCLAGTI